jgi:hypothetical protein
MLKIHQRLGLIDTAPLLATVILGAGSGGKSTTSTDRYAHLALGSVTGDLYFMSAYYAIRAPKIPGTEVRGQIRLHKALAWIHGPGMILTPILGAMAFDQKSKGGKVHGIASAHGAVAIVPGEATFGLDRISGGQVTRASVLLRSSWIGGERGRRVSQPRCESLPYQF